MPGITDIASKRRWPASVAAAVILTSTLCLGGLAGSASADERGRDHRGYQHREYQHRDWDRGRYWAPPVVYGTPYYAPPIVYGPGWGVNINIR